MAAKGPKGIDYRSVELDGVRYVIVRESVFNRLCERANVKAAATSVAANAPKESFDLDGGSLAEKLVRRRLAAHLSQAELARRAGVRPETLNRIERGRTTPDFATIRKLVVAMNAAEEEFAKKSVS
jgi:DNA-binding XRE family transcriptional regulator